MCSLPRLASRLPIAQLCTHSRRLTTNVRFRSKNYNPSKESTPKTLLEPHILSSRLIKLCNERQIDKAVDMLKNSPLDAQNVPVWNTLIWECLKGKRFRLAYELYIDMKRRGHRPNTRTFQTLMNGISRIDNWDAYPKQLSHAQTIYQAFIRHVASVKQHDPSSTELSVAPIASYMKILGAAAVHQDMFDVYYSLDSDGVLTPDHFLFTAMFQALSVQPTTESGDFLPNAASAKLLWNLMLKARRKANFPIDGHLVSSAIVALSRGRPTDQAFAFSLAEEHFGLSPDGDASPRSREAKEIIHLEPQSLAAILTLCRHSSRPLYAIELFTTVLGRPESQGGASIIDRAHVEQALQSLIAAGAGAPSSSQKGLELVEWMLAQEVKLPSSTASKIRPKYSTFNLLISHLCRTDNNWPVAARAFDMMTGYHCHDFMDGVQRPTPRLDARSTGRNISPTLEILSSMVRIAVDCQDRANIRQALRIVHHFRIVPFLSAPQSQKTFKDTYFYASKLARAVMEGLHLLSTHSGERDRPRDGDVARWKILESEAREVLGSEYAHAP
ncbi:hypothetical protein D9757_000025 [Collybiopsis confluens]|uniref:Pentatricopeptide repeat-containing protein n=1 Tax=Collybiopsis confluens TaxID=2823264 RepID=A0A8H5I1Y0_9AGAR|nr:hypothetical protein D9757_000025 [Collybiopsis confluens]